MPNTDSLYQYYNPGASTPNRGDIVNGQYYYKNPDLFNPVPVPTVPGAEINPDTTQRRLSNLTQGFVNSFPSFIQTAREGIVPQAQAELAAQQATAPGLNELLTQLFAQYGPQLNQIGSDIARQNQTNQAMTDRDVMAGPGKDTVANALELAKMYDPEYFNTRATTAKSIDDLLASIDLSGGLSGGERAEIERAQAQEGMRRGNYNAPSNSDATAAAMQFGEKQRAREVQNKNLLSQAIASSTAFLPASRTGFDTFAAGTGKGQVANVGNSVFGGVQRPTGTASDLASTFYSGMTGLKNTEINTAAQAKDTADMLSQFAGTIGSLYGGGKGPGG